MQLLGAKVVPVESGSAHPQGRHQRGAARLGRQRRPHGVPLRDGGRPAPVPEHGPRLHPRHRRRGPRPVPRARPAGCPTRSRPASAAAPTRSGCSPRSSTTRRRDLRLRGRRRRRRDRPARRDDRRAGRAACCTAPAPSCSRTRTARPSSPTRSRPASTTPASGPQHAHLAKYRPGDYLPVTDAEAMDALALLARTEGIIPAIESAHAVAGALRRRPRAGRREGRTPSCWSTSRGRGDKDMEHRHRVVRPRRPGRAERARG